jgi:hypothetical protein
MGTVRAVVAVPVGRAVVDGWTELPMLAGASISGSRGTPPSDAAEHVDLRCPGFRPKAIETSAESAIWALPRSSTTPFARQTISGKGASPPPGLLPARPRGCLR